jgi:hypothetical protein
MESLIELFEREAFRIAPSKGGDITDDFPLTDAIELVKKSPALCAPLPSVTRNKQLNRMPELVYIYWSERRAATDNALIRRFRVPPPATDQVSRLFPPFMSTTRFNGFSLLVCDFCRIRVRHSVRAKTTVAFRIAPPAQNRRAMACRPTLNNKSLAGSLIV